MHIPGSRFGTLVAFARHGRACTWAEIQMKARYRAESDVSIDRPRETEDDIMPFELEDWAPNPEESYSEEELRNILAACINKLDPGSRIVVQLRDIEGFATLETAQALGLSLTAVKSRLTAAIAQFAEWLLPSRARPVQRHSRIRVAMAESKRLGGKRLR